jgi:hypothetical protein
VPDEGVEVAYLGSTDASGHLVVDHLQRRLLGIELGASRFVLRTARGARVEIDTRTNARDDRLSGATIRLVIPPPSTLS